MSTFSKTVVGVTLAAIASFAGCSTSSETAEIPSSTARTPAAAPCTTPDLDARIVTTVSAAAETVTFALRNKTSNPCSLEGFPTVGVSVNEAPFVTASFRVGNGYGSVALLPQESAYFDARYVSAPVGSELCSIPTRFEIEPPASSSPLLVPVTSEALKPLCRSGDLKVTAVRVSQTDPTPPN